MLEDSLYAKRCKAIQKNSFSKKQIPNTLFCSKIQKYEPLHNSQDEVSRQIDVPLRKDASSTNSMQKNFPMQKNFHIYNPNPFQKKWSPSYMAEKFLGEGVAEKKHRNQACLVCFFEARGKLSPL
jgi:hypothetical protein